jgi:hypothetical protein
MIFAMALISRISTGAAILAVTGGAAAVLAGFGAGAASAAVGDNLPDNCLQYSQDGGSTWGGSDVIAWQNVVPVPGDINDLQAQFKARNNCDTPAKLQVYAGNWSVTPAGSATIHATLNTNAGGTTTLQSGVGDPGKLVNETKRLTKGTPVDVKLYIGIPQSETEQGYNINPDWSLALEEVAPDAPAETPTNPGGGNTGGCAGSGSLSGLGSLGSGSLCSATGSLGSNRAGLAIKVHAGDAVDSPTIAGNVK